MTNQDLLREEDLQITIPAQWLKQLLELANKAENSDAVAVSRLIGYASSAQYFLPIKIKKDD